ncbi:DNA repair protein RecN [Saxibacter everestensis]|uniref:DNA repair protein RecN n=1 Tax=Saxibacter everestensis TaxID=2909229 RepID=A0ABY8QY91_9MICO|nr:DNA repair protein RecN [Brevibacteriaceae bacterium ZFBP1038]
MIEELRIRDLGVISEATVELGPGLTVVSGETGAGKTMVVTALGLLLGARADSGAVRAGAKQASVDGSLRLPADSRAAARIDEAGGEIEDDGIVLSRSVLASGRSRGFAGGRSVPVGVLVDVGAELVTVHGQSEQIRLRSATAQRDILDRFAGPKLAAELTEYRAAYSGWRAASDELETLRAESSKRTQEADLLRFGLEEISQVEAQPGEDAELKSRANRLAHEEDLRIAAEQSVLAVTGGDDFEATSVIALLDTATRALAAVEEHDGQLAKLADRCRDLGYQAADLGAELASYATGLEAGGAEELAGIEQRRAELAKLTRKYGETIDDVLRWEREGVDRLAAIDGDDDRIAELEQSRDRQHEAARQHADKLHALRIKAAEKLGTLVSAELHALSMPNAKLVVDVTDRGQLGSHGADDVALLLAPHQGSTPREISKGASGGELSRVMLALEVVIAGVDPVPTFVFDEVDSGVGGKAAVEIGRRLAKLAQSAQVLVVTHLPQVAAWADAHLQVSKTADSAAGITLSDVRTLDLDERKIELARMLAGDDESEAALTHAGELLDSAAAERGSWKQAAAARAATAKS